ncbi:hypothetical protein BDV06DRAFT_229304 [Aspergillus oleicola]
MSTIQTPQIQIQGPQPYTVSDYIRKIRANRNSRPQHLVPIELRHESPLSQLEMDYLQLGNDLSSSTISQSQVDDKIREMSRLARSNAVRGRNPPGKSAKRDSILGSSSSSSSGSASEDEDQVSWSRPGSQSQSHYSSPGYSPGSQRAGIASRMPIKKYHVRDLKWRPSDGQLPGALRQLVDEGRTCDVIGLYIVSWLHNKASRYAGLVGTQVSANKPYWEITVRLFKTLNLRNEHEDPLHAQIVLGDPNSVPCPEKPTQRGLAEGPELIAPSHARLSITGNRIRYLLDEMTDEQLDTWFAEANEEIGDAQVVTGTRCAARVVQTAVPMRAASRRVGHGGDNSNWN